MINVIICAAGLSNRFGSNKLLEKYGKSVILTESIRPFLEIDDVEKIISEIVANNESMVKERQMGAMGPLMGMCMKQLKGKADGGMVNKIVREEIQKLI